MQKILTSNSYQEHVGEGPRGGGFINDKINLRFFPWVAKKNIKKYLFQFSYNKHEGDDQGGGVKEWKLAWTCELAL